ncbi:4-(cytidine 5'-diphospho)-2-C-methyl-D-erythritol kinase [Sneathiella litorea]|uniref:4-diphosphocytidyl-2-C-methyl-D-erythritol kinase n=1 Tax=Sneathiella litorea TaxID=2606216 RepID=A0A6L8W3P6_9PROT|nr:4-(cytidine 5'-diphospho)-2-C-methyl-D-erythritol kinase [Sneathiella litorea]MZR29193.1 4-(cytidine 5'-diphospho)-2-C-methyl-D-erythritol kinase [Sneathiella litorea]
MITAIARAKINLFLHVTGKQPDGYHLLESLVVFPDGGDEITVSKSKDLSLEVIGPFSHAIGSTDENLILKAAQLLKSESGTDQGAHITLVKNLPVAAGIGGGSSDAAITLKTLNGLWGIDFSDDKLSQLGLTLGADVPACLYGKPAIMSGIGEQLAKIDHFPEFDILLVNSGLMVSTRDVFSRLEISRQPSSDFCFEDMTRNELFSALATMRNDLEEPACQIAPVVKSTLSAIRGQKECRLARMSGSGATCFGLFETERAAQMAKNAIQSHHPDWWVQTMAVGL